MAICVSCKFDSSLVDSSSSQIFPALWHSQIFMCGYIFQCVWPKTLLSYGNPNTFNSDSGQLKPYGGLDPSDQQPTSVSSNGKLLPPALCFHVQDNWASEGRYCSNSSCSSCKFFTIWEDLALLAHRLNCSWSPAFRQMKQNRILQISKPERKGTFHVRKDFDNQYPEIKKLVLSLTGSIWGKRLWALNNST